MMVSLKVVIIIIIKTTLHLWSADLGLTVSLGAELISIWVPLVVFIELLLSDKEIEVGMLGCLLWSSHNHGHF